MRLRLLHPRGLPGTEWKLLSDEPMASPLDRRLRAGIVAPSMGRHGPAVAAGALSGILLGSSTLPWEVGWIGAIALAPLLRVLAAGIRPCDGALAGFLAGIGWYGIAFAWFPFVEGGRWQLAVLYVAYVPFLALGCAGFGAALAALRRLGATAQLTAAPGLWLVVEESQGLFLDSGVSWLRLAHGVAPWPSAIQMAAIGGVGLVSAWLAATSAGLVAARGMALRGRVALALALASPLVAGACLAHAPVSQETIAVGAVEPGVAQAEKFVPDRFDAHLRGLVALTDAAVADGAALVVWPESAYERPFAANGFDPFLAALARDLGAPLVTGVRRVEPSRPREGRSEGRRRARAERNAAVVLEGDGALRALVDKAFLVPVFEAAPRSAWSRLLARRGLWPGRFEPGPPPEVVRVGGTLPLALGVLVCFDVTQPHVVRALRRDGARLLLNPANEALSGRWSAVSQARIARLRAVESGAPLVRAANTGPTEWIDARGVLVHALAGEGAGAGVATLALAGAPPPFVRFGAAPAWLAVTLPFGAALSARARVLEAMRRSGARRLPSVLTRPTSRRRNSCPGSASVSRSARPWPRSCSPRRPRPCAPPTAPRRGEAGPRAPRA